MATYKNIKVQAHDGVTSNLRFAQGDQHPTESGDWVQCDELELDLSGADYLYRVDGVEYFGRL